MITQLCLFWLLGLVTVVVASYLVLWSIDLWRDPDSFDPNSWAYQRYVSWMRAYQHGKWKERVRSTRSRSRPIDRTKAGLWDMWDRCGIGVG